MQNPKLTIITAYFNQGHIRMKLNMSEYKHKITVLTISYNMSDYIEENIGFCIESNI